MSVGPPMSMFSITSWSSTPRLSDTESSARRIRTSPASMISVEVDSVASDISSFLDQDPARILWVDPYRTAREEPDRTWKQLVLDRVNGLLDRLKLRRIRKLERLLQDDRPAVHPLVHEVDRHAHHAYAVIHGLLDGPEAPKRRKQRRMHVDNPPLEAADELRTEDLHEAGEHHQIHLMLVEPVAENTVASVPVATVLGRGEHAGVDRRGARALEPPRAGPVGGHAHHLDPIAPVELVQDRLEVGPLPGDHDRDSEAHAATEAGGTLSTGRVPPVVASLFCSISSSIRARMSARRMWDDA